ncbi:hypothetical protein TNCV_4127201 [Trichonephila clavipes]|uniref:Uncharacterized protein n=1 Tax=Trichonephila clavipes TaxID=2585209 RepID=A0A8X6SXA9_TRICX|nr:hypothetical protein TNCV_4127201 [Trichonephila clavipes]
MGEVRSEFALRRVTLDLEAIPLCPAKISKHWSQKQTSTIWCTDPWINRSCTFPPLYELIDSQYRCYIVHQADKSGTRLRFRKRSSFIK